MTRRLCALLLGLGLIAAQPAFAEEVTVQGLLEDAMRRSPAIQAKRRAYEAARARVFAAWLPNDPEFGVDAEGQSSLFGISGRTNTEYMVQQTVPFPTTLILRGRIALRDAQIAYQQYQEAVRDVLWHLEQPYYELYLAKKTLVTLDELRALLEKVSSAVQARYETNRASQQDLLKARIELSKLDIELFQMRQQEHLGEAHLSHLLNVPLQRAYTLPEERPSAPLTVSLEELERRVVRERSELRAAAIGIQRAKSGRLLAQTRWLPDLTGRIETRQFKDGRDAEHDTFIGVTVPVWSLLKGLGGEWTAAHRDVQEAEAMYEELKNEILLAIHEGYAKTKSAEHALTVYEQFTLPQAKQQVEVALAAYEAGRTDFLDLIDAQRMLKDIQLSYYKARAEHELGLASLRFAIGGELNREGERR